MPGLVRGEVELEQRFGYPDADLHRSGDAVGGVFGERVDDVALEVGAVAHAEAERDEAVGAELVTDAVHPSVVHADAERAAAAIEVAGVRGDVLVVQDVTVRRLARLVADLGHGGCRRDGEKEQECQSHAAHGRRRSRPVMSSGGSTPRSPSTVGATSRREPPLRRGASPPVTATKGTGLVVWAVWGPPVAGSIIISQLP